VALDLIGDRWSLLIVRDLMVRGLRTFKDFHEAGEGIATNILADRLHKLEQAGIITAEGRSYALTAKGIDLAPALLELLLWSAKHEKTSIPAQFAARLEGDRQQFLDEVRRRWRAGDSTPLITKDIGRMQ
jgi:DNA-binding HxlR family transcriptional regulator